MGLGRKQVSSPAQANQGDTQQRAIAQAEWLLQLLLDQGMGRASWIGLAGQVVLGQRDVQARHEALAWQAVIAWRGHQHGA